MQVWNVDRFVILTDGYGENSRIGEGVLYGKDDISVKLNVK